MIDLNHVALFVRVVEAGSFSGAARALGIPKATVSRKVASLEAELGARLLHRTTRKLEPTALGRRFYEQSNAGLSLLHSAEDQASATRSVPSGKLRVAAPVEMGARQLMDALPEFLRAYPQVSVELTLNDGFVDLVAERIDVAFRTGRLKSSSFVARKLAPTRRVLLASPNYLRTRGTPKRLQDLSTHDCIVFGASLDNTTWRLDGPRPHGRSDVQVRGRVAVDSARAALRGALIGLGIALLPVALARDELEDGRLQQVLTRYGVEGGGLYLVYPSNRHPSAALRAFVDFFEPRVR
jgi:DNA-binding transcriptional LysR family regulator